MSDRAVSCDSGGWGAYGQRSAGDPGNSGKSSDSNGSGAHSKESNLDLGQYSKARLFKQLIITTAGTSAASGSKTYEIADTNGQLPARVPILVMWIVC